MNHMPFPLNLQLSVTSPTSKTAATNNCILTDNLKHIYFDDEDMAMLCADSDYSSSSFEEKVQRVHHPSPISQDNHQNTFLNINHPQNTSNPASIKEQKKRRQHKKQISEDLTENLHIIVNNGRKIDNNFHKEMKINVTPVPSISPSSDANRRCNRRMYKCVSDTDSEEEIKKHIQLVGNSISDTNTPTVINVYEKLSSTSILYNYPMNAITSTPIVSEDTTDEEQLMFDIQHKKSIDHKNFCPRDILSQLHSVTSDQLLQLMIMGECDIEDETDTEYEESIDSSCDSSGDSSRARNIISEDDMTSDVPSPSYYTFDHLLTIDNIKHMHMVEDDECTAFSYNNIDESAKNYNRNRKTRTFVPTVYNTANVLQQYSNRFSSHCTMMSNINNYRYNKYNHQSPEIKSANFSGKKSRTTKMNLLYKSKSASARNFGRNRSSQRKRFFSHAEKFYGAGDSDESLYYSDDCFEEYEQRKTLVVPSIFSINDADEMILSPVASNTITNQDRQSLLDMFAYSIADYSTDEDSDYSGSYPPFQHSGDIYNNRITRRRYNKKNRVLSNVDSNGSIGSGSGSSSSRNFNSNNMITKRLLRLLDEEEIDISIDIDSMVVGMSGGSGSGRRVNEDTYDLLCSNSSMMMDGCVIDCECDDESGSGSERKSDSESDLSVSVSVSGDSMCFMRKVYNNVLPMNYSVYHHSNSLSMNDVESGGVNDRSVVGKGLMVIDSGDDGDDGFFRKKSSSPMRYNLRQEKSLNIIEKR